MVPGDFHSDSQGDAIMWATQINIAGMSEVVTNVYMFQK